VVVVQLIELLNDFSVACLRPSWHISILNQFLIVFSINLRLQEDGAFAFRGIPYARPPVGDLRWKPAQPLDDMKYCWNGTYKAHNSTPPCWQIWPDGVRFTHIYPLLTALLSCYKKIQAPTCA